MFTKRIKLSEHKIKVRMLLWVKGLRDHITNDDMKKVASFQLITTHLMQKRLSWYGHVRRRDDSHMIRSVLDMELEGPKVDQN